MKCSFCNKDAIVHIRYNGTHLCQDHFNHFLEKRVRLEFRNEISITKPTTIGVAISGGKDSAVALYETNKIFGKRKDVKIIAITIDEGIEGYRPKTIVAAKNLTKKLGVEHHIVKLKDKIGLTMDSISQNGKLSPCSYCGVFRRRLLNDISIEFNVDYLVTGLNLDDTAQSIIMNIARGDVERMNRMGPHIRVKEGLVPRLQPLRRIPEKEVLLFAIINNIDFSHETCPYADMALRNEFREAIDKWEERTPGTKFAILNSYDKIKSTFELYGDKNMQINRCKICGAPTAGEICKKCSMEMELKM